MNPPRVPAGERAGLARRLASLAYEALLLAAIVIFAGFATVPLMTPGAAGARALTLPGMAGRAAGFVTIAALVGAYFVWCWTNGRRTLPMKTWRMWLVREDGAGPVDAGRAVARYLAGWVGPVCALAAVAVTGSRWAWALAAAGTAWALVDRDRQFLHDRIAGTTLVVEPRTEANG